MQIWMRACLGEAQQPVVADAVDVSFGVAAASRVAHSVVFVVVIARLEKYV